MNNTTVLIIGAGPVGLTLACEMVRRNIPCRIIERSAAPQIGSRAKALQPRSLEIFDNLGIADKLMQQGYTELPYRKYNGPEMIGESPRKHFLRNDTRFPKVLLLPQYQVEAALRDKFEELGGKIEWGTELADFNQTDNGIVCQLQTPNWTEDVNCTYLVACDGGKSTTRKKLGIAFIGETHQEEQLWVGDVEVEGLKPDAWYNWLSAEYGLAFALFPFKNSNNWQLQAAMPADAQGKIPTPTLEGFNQLFKERTQIQNVSFTNSTWQSIYRVNVRRTEKYRVGNAFICGDACHVHSIAGGMGMNTGIQDAYNLGWKLAAVINGNAKDELLDTYAEERIPIADWLLKAASERQKAMIAAATAGKGAFETLATNDGTQLDLNYRDSSLGINNPHPQTELRAGDRAPNVQLANGSWISEQLQGAGWDLLLFGDADIPAAGSLNVIKVKDNAIVDAYKISSGVVLIRPDGHIALIADEVTAVAAYFDKLVGYKGIE
ncbi:MAG: FAD-dependent monooxygenase [Mucilaginibacter sp.]|nr:FAD-dependent monooxygenase [Mucilaginibacter sp.]